MNKIVKIRKIIVVVATMLIMCSCGSSNESGIVKEFQKSLLRPETFTIRDAWTLDGSVRTKEFYEDLKSLYKDEKAYERDYAEQTRDCNFILLHCTYENAGGVMEEHYVLYDKDTDKYTDYSMSDITDIGSKVGTIPSGEQFVFDAAGDYLDSYDYGNKLTTWTDSQIDSLNKTLKK
ncbi:hypothetical protein D6855_14345 [Butyrivibrio sp. CB08]|uniref:hypothetical protein n=1 Tax=Butyrivibrio sp. CB08 TaxID=2364879 RepID=UPI000EA95227|nr:hypothetical protein [Butyrivibrio sp. CB08]RKM56845.1 hypothetical protein D6855_14345 [Butyrivibrio sp. CB08]